MLQMLSKVHKSYTMGDIQHCGLCVSPGRHQSTPINHYYSSYMDYIMKDLDSSIECTFPVTTQFAPSGRLTGHRFDTWSQLL